jgi:hypothetical protein
MSFDFISNFRVAPVAIGTTEHNKARPNTQKSRNHLASLEGQDHLAFRLFRQGVGTFDYLTATHATTWLDSSDYLVTSGRARDDMGLSHDPGIMRAVDRKNR